MSRLRDMTVGELIAALSEFPDYYPVVPFVQGTEGVCTGVRQTLISAGGEGDSRTSPAVWIGEVDIPPHLQESVIHRAKDGAA